MTLICRPLRFRSKIAQTAPFEVVMEVDFPREIQEMGLLQNQSADDPIQPCLSFVKKYVDAFHQSGGSNSSQLVKILEYVVTHFQQFERYLDDIRFLKICVIYADLIQDFKRVYEMMSAKGIYMGHSFLYEAYAVHLELKGKWDEANTIYELGISRNAEPLERLENMHRLFLERVSEANVLLVNKVQPSKFTESGNGHTINPWSKTTIDDLLHKMNKYLVKYNGYYWSGKDYHGKLPTSSSGNISRNLIVDLGKKKYQIKGCAGKGGFAQVFKSHACSNPEEPIALKVIQKPAFPWEFYMYRQLDERILSSTERSNFGFAHRIHIYANCSILVCDYVGHGTLQDIVNSYLVAKNSMDEVVCIYYTIEMLRMIEILHSIDIIHGDFKPDNLLVRYATDELLVEDFASRSGSWKDQGLCLVDLGRGIDRRLFPNGAEFLADCRTSGFRCNEMRENRPWMFQVDSYGLCVVVHTLLHGKYMDVEKISSADGSYCYQPVSAFKRYWNVDLWKNLFSQLLNLGSSDDTMVLKNLRSTFENYLSENPQLIKKLIQLLARQRTIICSSK